MAAASISDEIRSYPDLKYFYEDEVFRVDENDHVKFGLVLETPENYSIDEDDVISKGHVRVAWHPDGEEEVVNESMIGLADRTLMPGDVVRRLLPGKETQRGYCREIKMEADVQISGTKYVVRNVAAERLTSLMSVPKDSAVCLDSWVGSSKCIDEKIVLMSPCGALIEVPDIDLDDLKDRNAGSRSGLFKETVFYPGQILRGKIEFKDNVKLLTPSITLKTNKEGKFVTKKFVVQSVQLEGVWVHWQCRAFAEEYNTKKNSTNIQPKSYVTGEDLKRLKRLNLFESCMLQINDKSYLKLHESDEIIKKSCWEKEKALMLTNLLDNYHKTQTRSIGGQTPAKLENSRTRFRNSCFDNGTQYSTPLCCSAVPTSNVRNSSSTDFETNEILKAFKIPTETEDVITGEHDEWLTDEDKSETNSAATTISSCSNTTPKKSSRKCFLVRKKKFKKLKKNVFSSGVPKIGEKLVTEVLVVHSAVTVVWQDGTVEAGVPSTQLYPIHHLDDHEFFPGDFVLPNSGKDQSLCDYGVVQIVDHQGRTARVKWFKIYTSQNEDRPTYAGETEVSVYDLKDHPDFQFRPGTIVIRIGNFVGEEAASCAGQVIDNYTDGLVKVWWVDGHISMCWPQDIFEVAQYDGDPNWSGSENNSWVTESEETETVGIPKKFSVAESLLSLQLERAVIAMSRLEEIFTLNPKLQSCEIMRNLLTVYKKCRYLDRLIGTSFFHEHHFKGLIERVRKGGNQTKFDLRQDQENEACMNFASVAAKSNFPSSCASREVTQTTNFIPEMELISGYRDPTLSKLPFDFDVYKIINIPSNSKATNLDDISLETKSFSGRATANCKNIYNLVETPNMNLIHKSSGKSPAAFTAIVFENECSEFVCARLCALLKAQLERALREIQQRYAKPSLNLREAIKDEITLSKNDGDFDIVTTNEQSPLKLYETPAIALPSYQNFQILEMAPSTHKFYSTIFHPSSMQFYVKAVKREHKLLRTSLPSGIWARAFEDRMDLLSIMIAGPKGTPYEDGLFFFDVQLGREYPKFPPVLHYISFCSDRLNPNLYEDGKVCVSLLGTWSGKESETWGPKSTLLQVIISIQGLILVAEPYFNEAGYERQKGTQQGMENSRMYNEMVILKMVQSMSNIISSPPEIFRDQITSHFKNWGLIFCNRIKSWMKISQLHEPTNDTSSTSTVETPTFPLIPTSRGFCLTLTGLLENFRRKLEIFIN